MMGGCRGVAGKPAAFARTQDANLSSSAPQYGYLSTPHPRVPLHVIRAYMDRQGCTPRWVGGRIAGPAAPTPPLRSRRRGEKHATPSRQGNWSLDGVGVAGVAANVAYSLPVPFFRQPPVLPGDS